MTTNPMSKAIERMNIYAAQVMADADAKADKEACKKAADQELLEDIAPWLARNSCYKNCNTFHSVWEPVACWEILLRF